MKTHNLGNVRQSFDDFMFARNEQLKIEGHDESSEFWVTNSHYQTWLTAQDIYSYQDNILSEQNQQLAVQNAELAATVEALKSSLREQANVVMKHTMARPDKDDCAWSKAKAALSLCEQVPQQHLRDVRAEAGRKAYLHCLNHWSTEVKPSTFAGLCDNYADSVRAGEK